MLPTDVPPSGTMDVETANSTTADMAMPAAVAGAASSSAGPAVNVLEYGNVPEEMSIGQQKAKLHNLAAMRVDRCYRHLASGAAAETKTWVRQKFLNNLFSLGGATKI